MDFSSIYSKDIPDYFLWLCEAPELQRLKQVGMNCGCEYTSFPKFCSIGAYSRYTHSVGVGRIVWHHTQDPAQSIAALLHDISTPVFAHVIDFLHGDHMTQEYTENRTETMIRSSAQIQEVLSSLGLSTEDVMDYHRYPIADNDSPRLSSDRLEYSLGNMVNYGFTDQETAEMFYRDIRVGINEEDEPELGFSSGETAFSFSKLAMQCSKVYVCDSDRYAMQMLSELIGHAIRDRILTEDDLYRTEPEVIQLLTSNAHYRKEWLDFRSYHTILTDPSPDDTGRRIIYAKKRYIDPLVIGEGRVSELFPDYGISVREFLSQPQNYAISGQKRNSL